MQKHVNQLYHNSFGVAFHWKEVQHIQKDKVQLIFRDMGFLLTAAELKNFFEAVHETKSTIHCCEHCLEEKHCRNFLLKTPVHQVDLAISLNELLYIEDLIEGTLFQLELNQIIDNNL